MALVMQSFVTPGWVWSSHVNSSVPPLSPFVVVLSSVGSV